MSLMLSGKQPYTRDAINELSDYLHIKPYELLMHPQDAMALRSFYRDAVRIATSADMDESVRFGGGAKKVSLG